MNLSGLPIFDLVSEGYVQNNTNRKKNTLRKSVPIYMQHARYLCRATYDFLCRLLVINVTSESKNNSEVQNKLGSLKGWKLLPVLRTSADLSLLIMNIAWYSCVPVSCQNVERMRFYLQKRYSNNSKNKAHFVIFK